ncbi:MAG: hypothetical protein WB819_19910 [Terriglobia bacterium]
MNTPRRLLLSGRHIPSETLQWLLWEGVERGCRGGFTPPDRAEGIDVVAG